MLFGIFSLSVVGISLSLVGMIMGATRKFRIDTGLLQAVTGLTAVVISLIVILFQTPPECSSGILLLTCTLFLVGGFLNFGQLLLMSEAMNRGPNGIIWSLIQSALIFPFLMGTLVFHSQVSWLCGGGFVCLLAALLCFGLGKPAGSSVTGDARWKLLAVVAFLCTGGQQVCANIPSYFPEMTKVSSVIRTLMAGAGMAGAAVLYIFIRTLLGKYMEWRRNLNSKIFWMFVLGQQGFSLLASYFLLYQGMDRLARSGIGAISYPLLVGSCLISFNAFSLLILKERLTPLQTTGLILCIPGVVGICL